MDCTDDSADSSKLSWLGSVELGALIPYQLKLDSDGRPMGVMMNKF